MILALPGASEWDDATASATRVSAAASTAKTRMTAKKKETVSTTTLCGWTGAKENGGRSRGGRGDANSSGCESQHADLDGGKKSAIGEPGSHNVASDLSLTPSIEFAQLLPLLLITIPLPHPGTRVVGWRG